LGRRRSNQLFEHGREVLRAKRADAYTYSERNAYAQPNSNCHAYTDCHTYTQPDSYN
jgi:hypothetical protein